MAAEAVSASEILLNGEPYELNGRMQLADLIKRLGMKPARIAVELNHRVVPKAEYEGIVLAAGDRLEIVNFVGGG
jgi:thiamine biosynthesis protein ThiS